MMKKIMLNPMQSITKINSNLRFIWLLIPISLFCLACTKAPQTKTHPMPSIQPQHQAPKPAPMIQSAPSQTMQAREGWQNDRIYLSYGSAIADTGARLKQNETEKDSCRRKAVFNAKSRIVPAFMNSPNAKPSTDIQSMMVSLLGIIENAQVVDFEYNGMSKRCTCLIKIEQDGLRPMVETIR